MGNRTPRRTVPGCVAFPVAATRRGAARRPTFAAKPEPWMSRLGWPSECGPVPPATPCGRTVSKGAKYEIFAEKPACVVTAWRWVDASRAALPAFKSPHCRAAVTLPHLRPSAHSGSGKGRQSARRSMPLTGDTPDPKGLSLGDACRGRSIGAPRRAPGGGEERRRGTPS